MKESTEQRVWRFLLSRVRREAWPGDELSDLGTGNEARELALRVEKSGTHPLILDTEINEMLDFLEQFEEL